jgi:hypothetical protein
MTDYTTKVGLYMAKRSLKKFETNPLLTMGEIKLKERVVKSGSTRELIDAQSGEVHAVNAIYQRKIVDQERFAKLYVDGVSKTFELGSAARKVFTIILKVCQKDTDRIYLNFMVVQQEKEDGDEDISERTFQRGMAELVAKGFIAASTMPSMFWINVHLFFNGDRVRFITEYVKAVKNKDAPAELVQSEENGQGRLI